MNRRSLLIVDDDQHVINSLNRELRNENYSIFMAKSGEVGLELARTQDIGVVLSDHMMPGMDGVTFLRKLKLCKPDVIRILLTGNGSLENAMAAVNSSKVFGYLTKPWSPDVLRGTIAKAFDHYDLIQENSRLQKLTEQQNRELVRFNTDLEEMVKIRTKQLEEAVREGVVMLAMAAEAKDDDTGLHIQRIRNLTFDICMGLGLSVEKSEEISFFSMMHDIGKIHIPDSILKKKGPLSPEEWKIMRTHCVTGERILGNKPIYKTAREIARSHHERWDGKGYPNGLKKEEIPLSARIVTVADVFDALTNARPYKYAWSEEKALGELKMLSGIFFDPEILDVFLNVRCEKKRDSL